MIKCIFYILILLIIIFTGCASTQVKFSDIYIYYANHDYGKVIRATSMLLELDPENVTLYRIRGDSYRMLGKYSLALDDFNKANELRPDSIRTLADRGDLYRVMGQYQKAMDDLNAVIERDPAYSYALASRGATYAALGNNTAALNDLNGAIELKPTDSWAYERRAGVYISLYNYESASADLKKALEINPKSVWAYISLSRLHIKKGNYGKALDDLNTAISLDKHNSTAFTRRGFIYSYNEEYGPAAKDLDTALALDPENIWAYVYRAEIYQMIGDYDKGIQYINQAIKHNVHNEMELYKCIGLYYYKMGEYEKAMEQTLTAYDEKDSPDIQENIALCWYGLEQYDEALRAASGALAKDSSLIWAKLIIAVSYEKKHDNKNALKYFKLYRDAEPTLNFSRIYFKLDVDAKIKSLEP
jgi:tetratricopeptide (TPR) repeat protein